MSWANNITEQVIWRRYLRSRSVRGFKTWSGLINAFELYAQQFT